MSIELCFSFFRNSSPHHYFLLSILILFMFDIFTYLILFHTIIQVNIISYLKFTFISVSIIYHPIQNRHIFCNIQLLQFYLFFSVNSWIWWALPYLNFISCKSLLSGVNSGTLGHICVPVLKKICPVFIYGTYFLYIYILIKYIKKI